MRRTSTCDAGGSGRRLEFTFHVEPNALQAAVTPLTVPRPCPASTSLPHPGGSKLGYMVERRGSSRTRITRDTVLASFCGVYLFVLPKGLGVPRGALFRMGHALRPDVWFSANTAAQMLMPLFALSVNSRREGPREANRDQRLRAAIGATPNDGLGIWSPHPPPAHATHSRAATAGNLSNSCTGHTLAIPEGPVLWSAGYYVPPGAATRPCGANVPRGAKRRASRRYPTILTASWRVQARLCGGTTHAYHA